jgi:hypothetical protein
LSGATLIQRRLTGIMTTDSPRPGAAIGGHQAPEDRFGIEGQGEVDARNRPILLKNSVPLARGSIGLNVELSDRSRSGDRAFRKGSKIPSKRGL